MSDLAQGPQPPRLPGAALLAMSAGGFTQQVWSEI